MGKLCIVPSCKNSSDFIPNVIYFHVPNQDERRKAWFAAIRKQNTSIPKGHGYYCCEEHFDLVEDTTNWMQFKLTGGTRLKLKEDVVPHKNLMELTSRKTKRRPPSKKRKSEITYDITRSHCTSIETATPTLLEEERKKNQESLQQRRAKTTIELTENHSMFYLGLPKGTYTLVHQIANKENIVCRDILITLKKIRLDDEYYRLALDFGTTQSNIRTIFIKGVPKIANVMQNFLFFPTKEQITELLPIPFRYRYSNVQYIIDNFEIEIEKPSSPIDRRYTWSEHRECDTVKYLVSGTPHGFINFVSEGFGGRITDKNIIKASKYLNHISDCSIMADQGGFSLIEPLLSQKNCILIRPPSMSSDNIKDPLRIHIESIIKRIKEFKMIDSCVDSTIMFLLDHIVIIVCGLCNIQDPLIKQYCSYNLYYCVLIFSIYNISGLVPARLINGCSKEYS